MKNRKVIVALVFSVSVMYLGIANAQENVKASVAKKPKAPEKIMIYNGTDWKVQMYGFVKADVVHNTKDVVAEQSPFFVMPQKGKTTDQTRGSLVMSARQSRIGLKMKGPDVLGAKFFMMVEGDFWGMTVDSSSGDRQGQFRMRHAFAKLTWPTQTYLLVGQFNMLGIQEKVVPSMVTFQPMTASGFLLMRETQVRLGQTVGTKKFSTTLEIEGARAQGGDGLDALYTGAKGISGDERGVGEASETPIAQARLTFDVAPTSDLKIVFGGTGSYMRERHTPTTGNSEIVPSWFGMGFAKVAYGMVSLSGTIVKGQNLDQNLGGIGQGVIENAAGDGFDAVETTLGWAMLAVNFTKMGLPFKAATGYGVDNPDDKYLPDGSGRTKNRTIWGNVWFIPSSHYRFAVEVARMDTTWKNNGTATDYRTQATFMFCF